LSLADAAHAKLFGGHRSRQSLFFPGFSVHDEMALLLNAGLTPLKALRAATINPARYPDRELAAGSVAPGRSADLVLLDENPLTDIRNVSRINTVVLRAQLFNHLTGPPSIRCSNARAAARNPR
jgi:predicted amidohydrolase